MNHKRLILVIIALIILLPTAYYLLSPIWRVVEIQEESPLQVNDKMDTMTIAEKEQFEKEVNEAKKEVLAVDDQMMEKATVLAQGEFKPRAHEVMGNALLIQAGDSKILRFENFETINGPDLHIWLASSLGDEDYVDLGPIKATKGNVNYDVPAAVDANKYTKVLIWCVPFRVLFSYAELE